MNEKIYSFHTQDNMQVPFYIMMTGISDCDQNYYIHREKSNLFSIECVLNGQGILETEDKKYIVGPKDTFILYKDTKHTYYTEDDQWLKIWLTFDGTVVQPLFDSFFGGNRLDVIRDFDISIWIERIYQLAQENASYQLICDEAMIVLLRILQKYQKEKAKKDTEDLPHQIRTWLDTHINTKLVLDDLCKELHYSKNYIITQFKNTFHVTPYHYYKNRKMEMAKEYLVNTNLSVEKISDLLEFSNAKHFSAGFKQRFGVSPTGFRKDIRKR